MIAFIVLFFFGLSLWLFSGSYFKGKEILKFAGISLAIVSFGMLFISFVKKQTIPPIPYLFALAIFGIGFYLLWKIRQEKKSTFKVIANQQRYWNEVNGKQVYDYFKNRKKIKSNRVEIDVNKERKKFFFRGANFSENYYATPSFFVELNALELTKTDNYKDVEKSILYKTIFNKLKGIIKDKEITNDYDTFFAEALKDNGNYLEYFLIYLWENYTKDINIGIANLELLAVNNTEEQLIGALDIAFLHNMVYRGSAMFYAYKRFRGELMLPQAKEPEPEEDDDSFK